MEYELIYCGFRALRLLRSLCDNHASIYLNHLVIILCRKGGLLPLISHLSTLSLTCFSASFSLPSSMSFSLISYPRSRISSICCCRARAAAPMASQVLGQEPVAYSSEPSQQSAGETRLYMVRRVSVWMGDGLHCGFMVACDLYFALNTQRIMNQ